MAASAIGSVFVNLGLNSAAFSRGLTKSQKRMAKFAAGATVAFGALAMVARRAFGAVAQSAEQADKMFKASQSLGVPIEDLGRLAHAAEMSGSSYAGLEKGIRKASQTIQQSIEGASNEGSRALESLGVSLTDSEGKTASASDVVSQIADRFKAMPDGVEKTAAAMAIFGRSGTELIPMLNTGSEGLAAMGDEAERLGLVFSSDTGRAAEMFNDNLSRLRKTVTGLWNRVAANVLPAFIQLTNKFLEGSREGGTFDSIVSGISGAMAVLARVIGFVFDHLKDLFDLFKIFVAAKIVQHLYLMGRGFIALAATIRATNLASLLLTKITRMKITAILLLAAAVAKLTGQYENMVGWIKTLGEEIAAALPDSIKEGVGALAGELKDTVNVLGAADEEIFNFWLDTEQAGDSAVESFGNVKESVKGLGDAIDKTKDKAKTAAEKMHNDFKTVGESIRGAIRGTNSWNDVLLTVLETIAQIALKRFSDMMGGIPAPGGGVFSDIAGGILSGLFGFRDGATFNVGGAGLPDSQLVAFMASPDETVSVMTPEQRAAAARPVVSSGGNITNNISIQTPDVRSFEASRNQVAAQIARASRSGARNL